MAHVQENFLKGVVRAPTDKFCFAPARDCFRRKRNKMVLQRIALIRKHRRPQDWNLARAVKAGPLLLPCQRLLSDYAGRLTLEISFEKMLLPRYPVPSLEPRNRRGEGPHSLEKSSSVFFEWQADTTTSSNEPQEPPSDTYRFMSSTSTGRMLPKPFSSAR
jgi:hypothetical protein